MRILMIVTASLLFFTGVGCGGDPIEMECATQAECGELEEGMTEGMCVASGEAVVSATEEKLGCSKAVDAALDLMECRAKLSCADRKKENLGGNCVDEIGALIAQGMAAPHCFE